MTRAELHRMVWSEPATKIAARLSVSDSYLIRVCGILAVPRPPPGYWRKREVGLDPPVVPLPEAPPGTPREWVKGPRHPAARAVFRSRASDVDIPALMDRAALHFGAASPDDGGRYLRPRCRDLLDLTTTQPCLGKCVDFARALFAALWERGHEVRIAPPFEVSLRARIDPREDDAAPAFVPSSRAWRPMRPTVTYIGPTPIGLAVVETCEHLSMHYVGSGRFVSEAEYASLSPAERAGHTWKRNMSRRGASGLSPTRRSSASDGRGTGRKRRVDRWRFASPASSRNSKRPRSSLPIESRPRHRLTRTAAASEPPRRPPAARLSCASGRRADRGTRRRRGL
ncbi:hypothetical protein ACLJYM_24770 [Rhizobium giardinii]|uniref:hypothetical protein n=1 Tax=Rhizobium giardinii TaxID=56731 RepID=UPI0039E1C487